MRSNIALPVTRITVAVLNYLLPPSNCAACLKWPCYDIAAACSSLLAQLNIIAKCEDGARTT